MISLMRQRKLMLARAQSKTSSDDIWEEWSKDMLRSLDDSNQQPVFSVYNSSLHVRLPRWEIHHPKSPLHETVDVLSIFGMSKVSPCRSSVQEPSHGGGPGDFLEGDNCHFMRPQDTKNVERPDTRLEDFGDV